MIFILALFALGLELSITIYRDVVAYRQITSLTALQILGAIFLILALIRVRKDHARQLTALEKQLDSIERDAVQRTKLLTALFDHIPCAIASIGPDYYIRNVNTELTFLTGVPKDEALGKKCFDVFGVGHVCPNCPVRRAMESGKVQQNLKHELTRKDQEIYIEQIAIPIMGIDGQLDHTLEVVVDATEKVALQRKHDNLFIQTITALVHLIENRDRYTGFHSNRVRDIAVEIGKELGLEPSRLEELSIAAVLHDIGKIGIPEEILNKPGQLSPEEYEIIKKHPLIGYGALNNVDSLKHVANIILDHHERLDGKGYPTGKTKDQISFAARILSVADVYEAITSDRIYRKAMSKETALAILNESRGTQFDPIVVDALIKVKDKFM